MKQIDSLVSIITYSDLPTQRDSTLQDYPALGLNMKTYITVKTFGKDIKMYSQQVKSTRKENEITRQDVSGSAFYYDRNKLIKVEEFMLLQDKLNKVEWYFANDKCFFNTMKSDKAEARIKLLLHLTNELRSKILLQN